MAGARQHLLHPQPGLSSPFTFFDRSLKLSVPLIRGTGDMAGHFVSER